MGAQRTIYRGHSATTFVKPEVLETMIPWFTHHFGPPSSLCGIARYAKKAIDAARVRTAKAPGADPDKIYFTSGDAMYSGTMMDHFRNPRKVGERESPGRVREVGNPVCGAIMEIFLKRENNNVADTRFRTFCCGAATLSSSMATELVGGKTLEKAGELPDKPVAEARDGLPLIKMHCTVLAEEGIHKAINDYRQKRGRHPGSRRIPPHGTMTMKVPAGTRGAGILQTSCKW